MSKLSLYDLTYGYLKSYYQGDINDRTISTVMKDFRALLDKGWTQDELVKAIKNNRLDHKDFIQRFHKIHPRSMNLLKADTFYWHPQLRVTPGAPIHKVDYDSGEITTVKQEHFLEMRASYTLEDLMAYWEKQHGEFEPSKTNKFKGGFKYLLTNHSIDTVLFMIDASSNFVKAEGLMPLSSPLDMDNYEREARNVMGEKITEEKQAGDDGIVPRRRLPLHRGRSKARARVQTKHHIGARPAQSV